MLIETTTALYELICSINNDERISGVCKVNVLMAERYRELIAARDKDPKQEINYPIIVLHDNEMQYDRKRYVNEMVELPPKAVEVDGREILKSRVNRPYMPYNLSYRIEIVCKKRIQLDAILIWVMENIPDRGSLNVSYKDESGKDAIYESILKRGPIIKADEGTSSTLYRRTSEIVLTTLMNGAKHEESTIVEGFVAEYYMKGDDGNGEVIQSKEHQ